MSESHQKITSSGESLVLFLNQVFESNNEIKNELQEIKNEIKGIKSLESNSQYLPVKDFMAAISVGRTKFDELVADGKVRTVRPNGSRKLYVPASEVTRYFEGE